MYLIKDMQEGDLYFRKTKKEAVKKALEVFENQIHEAMRIYKLSREEVMEDYFLGEEEYNKCIEEIKTGDYYDDWVRIEKCLTYL